MIDCDIHNEIGDIEEFLGYVAPAQREWFRSHETALGLPGYTWSHPHSFYRDELKIGPGGEPARASTWCRARCWTPTRWTSACSPATSASSSR